MDYILRSENSDEHYFYKDGTGITVSCGKLQKQVFSDAKAAFGVLKSGNITHIVCVNKKNELVYIAKKGEYQKEYLLCGLNTEFEIRQIRLTRIRERIDLIFSVMYNNEILLIHSVLGNYAKPYQIDKMKTDYFFVYDEKVYYTKENGILGFCSLADGKADRFVSIAEDSKDLYIYTDSEKMYAVYIRDEAIYLNGIPKYKDTSAQKPIVVRHGKDLVLVWKSGAVVKYADLNKDTPPKRLISSGTPVLCSIQADNIYYDYNLAIFPPII